jgi:hypothetical protein
MIIREPSEKLKKKLDDVATHLRNAVSLVDGVFILGREEGFSDNEIGQMVRDRLRQLGYNPRSIRRLLPSSAKDLTKSRKGNLGRIYENGIDGRHEDKMSSFENSNNFDENQKIISSKMFKELQANISTLKEQLAQKETEIDDKSIQIKNSIQHKTELRDQLRAMRESIRTLILPRDKFPSNRDQVFKLQNYVFLVEFKDTEVLDIRVITLEQAYNQLKD